MKAKAIKEETNSYAQAGKYNLMVLSSAADGKFGAMFKFKLVTNNPDKPLADHEYFRGLEKQDQSLRMDLINDYMEAIGLKRFKEGDDIDIPDVPVTPYNKPIKVYMSLDKKGYVSIPAFVKGGKVFIAADADESIQAEAVVAPTVETKEDDAF